MKKIVISQPMFFPWVGLFEQIRMADAYVHYDDVQLPQGRSFMSRVQIKTPTGARWLTAPIKRGSYLIKETLLDDSYDWRSLHVRTLQNNYAKAPFSKEMLDIVRAVYSLRTAHLSELNSLAIETIAAYFDIRPVFLKSSDCKVTASSSERLLELVKQLDGTVYITGHGARNYLNHALFERHGIRVEYINYQKVSYKQLHGPFTPHVSVLDLIANVGKAGRGVMVSGTAYWKDFLSECSC